MLMLLFCSFIFHIADAVHSQSCILCCCTFYWTFMCIHNALGVPCIHIDVLIADESFHWLEVQFSIWIFYYCKFNFLLDSFSVNFVLNFLNVKFCFILKNKINSHKLHTIHPIKTIIWCNKNTNLYLKHFAS